MGNDDNDYAQFLKHTYASKSVLFLGKKEEITAYLAIADLFVIPTKDEGRKEGMPIAPLEAMACQRVVIGSNIAGIKDILQAFPHCLFKPNDPLTLKQMINAFRVMDTNIREQQAKQMRKVIETSFPIEKFISRHESLYINLVNNT